ncbi:MAG: peptidylprolyl isomerase [candidate division WOR-3 bacterium]|nr:peptidylprolyl isomerase [candidate division WOR-3 bacterium]
MIYLLLICLFSTDQQKTPIAIIADKEIYKEDIANFTSLNEYLKRLVFFKIAKEKGYDDSVRTKVEGNFSENLIRELYKKVVSKSKVNFAESRILYRKLGKALKVKLIQTEDFKTAYIGWAEVMRGKDFDEVSEKYSSDIKLKNKKGDIGWVRWDYYPSTLLRKAFRMKEGEVSFPFKENKKWNVIKVVEIKDINLPSYNTVKNGITDHIRQLKVKNLSDRHINYTRRILNVEINLKGLLLLFTRMPASKGKIVSSRPEFKPEDMDKVLARSAIGEYTIRELEEAIKRLKGAPPLGKTEIAKKFIEWQVIYNFLTIEAKRLGFHRRPDLSREFRSELINSTIRNWEAHEIETKINPTDEELKNFYKQNKENYRKPEKRKVYAIEVKTKEEAKKIKEELLRGKSFETLASKKSIGPGAKRGGLLGYITKVARGAIGKEAFRLRKGRTSNPFKIENGWAIIKVTDIKKSYIPEFSKYRYPISEDWKKEKREKIENEIFEKNKEKYGVQILTKAK